MHELFLKFFSAIHTDHTKARNILRKRENMTRPISKKELMTLNLRSIPFFEDFAVSEAMKGFPKYVWSN